MHENEIRILTSSGAARGDSFVREIIPPRPDKASTANKTSKPEGHRTPERAATPERATAADPEALPRSHMRPITPEMREWLRESILVERLERSQNPRPRREREPRTAPGRRWRPSHRSRGSPKALPCPGA